MRNFEDLLRENFEDLIPKKPLTAPEIATIKKTVRQWLQVVHEKFERDFVYDESYPEDIMQKIGELLGDKTYGKT